MRSSKEAMVRRYKMEIAVKRVNVAVSLQGLHP